MKSIAWTDHERDILRRLYPHLRGFEVAHILGRSLRAVHQRARIMGKTAEFYASFNSGHLTAAQSDPRLLSSRFAKGNQPWNKGKPGSTGTHANCRATQFKPDRARAVATVAGVLVDTARVEVEYIKSTGGDGIGFFGAGHAAPAIGHAAHAHNPFQQIAKRSAGMKG